jgi:hypothetical protein
MKKKLIEIGYSNDKKIIDDEIQAFMSTGLYNKFSGEELEKYEQSFIDNFKNF